jgi:type III secretory pathway lipoprotein EscJ
MFKKVLFCLLVIFLLTGCKQMQLKYNGEIRSEEEVEEMLGDLLESENPGMDIEVDVYEEVDD